MKYKIQVVKYATTEYKDVDSCFDGLIEEIDKAEAQGYKLKDVVIGQYVLENKNKERICIHIIKPLKEDE